MVDYKKQGKRNRAAGARFEKKTRDDLVSNGLMVSKWQNNVDLEKGKCVPAKPGRFRIMQTGFPDFIAYKEKPLSNLITYEIIFVEAKSNGYLSKEEKEKARWYLEHKYCGKFFITKKKKVGRKIEVEYIEFK